MPELYLKTCPHLFPIFRGGIMKIRTSQMMYNFNTGEKRNHLSRQDNFVRGEV